MSTRMKFISDDYLMPHQMHLPFHLRGYPDSSERSVLTRYLENENVSATTPPYVSTDATRITTWIIAFAMIVPCILVSIRQTIHCYKQRIQDRIDRELLAVTSNPEARRIILNEIFKNSAKEVTQDEVGVKKKMRTLVKKRRKKTSDEIKNEPTGSSTDDVQVENTDRNKPVENFSENIGRKVSKRYGSWWVEERVSSLKRFRMKEGEAYCDMDGEDRIVICISSDGLECNIDDIVNSSARNLTDMRESVIDSVDKTSLLNEDVSVGATADESAKESESIESLEVAAITTKSDHSLILNSVNAADGGTCTDECNEIIEEKKRMKCILFNIKIDDDRSTAPSCAGDDCPNKNADDGQPINCANFCSTSQEIGERTSLTIIPVYGKEAEINDAAGSVTNEEDQCFGDPTKADFQNFSLHSVFLQKNDSAAVAFENSNTAHAKLTCEEDTDLSRPNFKISYCDKFKSSSLTKEECLLKELQGGFKNGLSTSDPTDEAYATNEINTSGRGKELTISSASEIVHSFQVMKEPSEINTAENSTINIGVPLRNVESITDASSISYFSYEDISVEDEDSDICAICLTTYEEGDIRIFSKHCSHVFHKQCIFDWLVRGHNECPFCRIDMVTKSEINETSVSLMGSERLTQAMSAMVEAPPFHQRRRQLLPRRVLTRARRQSRNLHEARAETSLALHSPHAHWLWTVRFESSRTGAESNSVNTEMSFNPVSHSSSLHSHRSNHDLLAITQLDISASQSVSPHVASGNNNSVHRMSSTPQRPSNTDAPSGYGLASRSSDATVDRHQNHVATNEVVSDLSLQHHASAGSLFTSRNLHPNWTTSQNTPSMNRVPKQTVVLSPNLCHPHWQQYSRRVVDPPLIEIPGRPAVAQLSSNGTFASSS